MAREVLHSAITSSLPWQVGGNTNAITPDALEGNNQRPFLSF